MARLMLPAVERQRIALRQRSEGHCDGVPLSLLRKLDRETSLAECDESRTRIG
jgi:hypothetical protein